MKAFLLVEHVSASGLSIPFEPIDVEEDFLQLTTQNSDDIIPSNLRQKSKQFAFPGLTYPLINCGSSDIIPFENHSIPLFSLFSQSPEKYPVNIRLKLTNLMKFIHYREQFQAAFSSK